MKRQRGLVAAGVLALVGGLGLVAPANGATGTVFEVESLQYVYTGGAGRSGCGACSGGQKAGNISSTSSVTVDGIMAPAAGTYTVEIAYLSGDNTRRLQLAVNGQVQPAFTVPSTGGWGVVGTYSIQLPLVAGENTITISAPEGSWGPDVDKLTIEGVEARIATYPKDPNAADPVPRDETQPTATKSGHVVLSGGTVRVDYSTRTGTADISWTNQKKAAVKGMYSAVRLGDELVSTKQYAGGCAAKGNTITCKAPGKPTLVQTFSFDGKSGFFVQLKATSTDGKQLSSNMMVPVATDGANSVTLGSKSSETRFMLVPFDNDHWVRYEAPNAADLTPAKRSFEVASLFDPTSRVGLVLGSVDMYFWKSGVVGQGNARGGLDRLQAAAGLTDWSYAYSGVNRFNSPRERQAHKPQVGTQIVSPRFFVGISDDWRTGMETYGRHVADASNPMKWDQPTPFGFNSWGGLGARIGDMKVLDETSKFFAEELPKFRNTQPGDPGPYIGIDSYWDKLLQPMWAFEDPNTSWAKFEEYVKMVRARGQEPAIYFQPFANFWSEGLDQQIGGTKLCDTCRNQTFREMTLKTNGLPMQISGAWTLDPTNPGVQNRIKIAFTKFKELGIKYIKLDFMTNGYVEADSWYDPTVKSGREAFDKGMKQALSYLSPDTFVDLSIAPTFMGDYGHARRISCDVHGALNNWHPSNPARYQKSTEYLLNNVTYGWWLDEIYAFNDADHIQFGNYEYDGNANAYLLKDPYPSVWPEGQNRARVTSSVITGVYLVSEDFTSTGHPLIKERAKVLLQNEEINHIAEIGRTFQPVEAGPDDQRAANLFWHREGKTVYVAAFNYGSEPMSVNLGFKRLGIPRGKVAVTELWTGEQMTTANVLTGQVPAEDARVWKITLR